MSQPKVAASVDVVEIGGHTLHVEKATGAGPLQYITVRRGLHANMFFLRANSAAQILIPEGWYAVRHPDGYLSAMAPEHLDMLIDAEANNA